MKEFTYTAEIATSTEVRAAFAATGIEHPTSEQQESFVRYVRREAQEAAQRALADWVERKRDGKE